MGRLLRMGLAVALAGLMLGEATARAAEPEKPRHETKAHKKKDNGDAQWKGPFKHGEYPKQVTQRPLTLPANMGEVEGDFALTNYSIAGVSSTGVAIGARVGFGFSNKIEGDIGTDPGFGMTPGANLGLALSPSAGWNQSLGLEALYLAYDTHQFDAAPQISFGLQFASGGVQTLGLGARCRWLPGNKVYIKSLENLLTIGLGSSTSAALHLPLVLGYQASKEFAIELDTQLLMIGIAGTTGVTTIDSYLPIYFMATIAPQRKLDFLVKLGLNNVTVAGSGIGVGVGVRYRF